MALTRFGISPLIASGISRQSRYFQAGIAAYVAAIYATFNTTVCVVWLANTGDSMPAR
ncbi:MAG TPA: hypothetical protein VF040_18085 [Ktedonobacterales bacterium]